MATCNVNTIYLRRAHTYVYKNTETDLNIYLKHLIMLLLCSEETTRMGISNQREPEPCPQNFIFKGYVDSITCVIKI